jgi:prepilin-type N-terminal cleavage/methylation domain-containing protein
MAMTRTRRNQRGFSLMEVLLALVLFATATVASMELIQRGQAGARGGEEALIATHLAQRRMEELRNVAYASVASESLAGISSPSGYSRFSRQVTVTTPYTNLKQVVVTVSWTTQGGTASVSLRTFRSNV